MGVPLGNGGEKKFNWASELSTVFLKKSIVVSAMDLLFGIAAIFNDAPRFQLRPDLHWLTDELCRKL